MSALTKCRHEAAIHLAILSKMERKKKMMMVKPCPRWLQAACMMLLSCAASATEMVYAPVNPSFGGNPNNASGLLAVAQAQNGFKAPTKSALDTFNANLQSAILSRLTSESLTLMFGKSSTLVPGVYDTAGYTITVTDIGGGVLTIQTTDKTSGASATFTVSAGSLDQ